MKIYGIIEETHPPGSDAWHDARRTGIGGSDIAAVAGLGKFKSAHDVWLSKVGITKPQPPNIAMAVGSALEDTVIAQLGIETGMDCRSESLTIRHPEHPFIVVNTDGFVVDMSEYMTDNEYGLPEPVRVAGIEAKTSNQFAYADWQEGGVPINYYAQCQITMACTGMPRMYVPVIFGGNKFDHWIIERDEEDIAYLIEAARVFWGLVLTETPPAVDGSEGAKTLLNYEYAESNGETRYLEVDADAWVAQYEDAKAAEAQAKALKAEASAHLLDLIGEAKNAVTPDGYKVTSVRTRRFSENVAREKFGAELEPFMVKVLDKKKLQKEAKEIYEASKGKPSLSLRVAKPKVKK